MKEKRIKFKKLTRWEKRNSFRFIAPTSGILKPLTQSNDVIMRRGDLGIGFVLEGFSEEEIVSPISGSFIETINSSFGIVLLNTKHQVCAIVNFTGAKDYPINQGVQILPQIVGSKIRIGTPIIKIDREYLEFKNYTFQITVSFIQYEKVTIKKEKYDILYTFRGEVEQGDSLGRIYKVDQKKVLDLTLD